MALGLWEVGEASRQVWGPDHRLRTGLGPMVAPSSPCLVVEGRQVCPLETKLCLFLQEIKKKKGIKEEVQLTSKQKEMLQAQLDKEAQIRRRLQEVGSCPSAPASLTVRAGPADRPSGLTLLTAGR